MAITGTLPVVVNNTTIVGGGTQSFLNISAATAVKSSKGRIVRVNVTTAGTAAGNIYDRATTTGVAPANLVAAIPNTVGSYEIDFPCANGIVVAPGTGQVVSVSFC
jgi:hypothetical protein